MKFTFDQTVKVVGGMDSGFEFTIDTIWKRNGVFYYSGRNQQSGCGCGWYPAAQLKLKEGA